MSEFLQYWDSAIRMARDAGLPMYMRMDPRSVVFMTERSMRANNVKPEGFTARTMHPAFMGGVPPKFDPRRDA